MQAGLTTRRLTLIERPLKFIHSSTRARGAEPLKSGQERRQARAREFRDRN
jgi:hypothetical protein